jgi:hypothetical protein
MVITFPCRFEPVSRLKSVQSQVEYFKTGVQEKQRAPIKLENLHGKIATKGCFFVWQQDSKTVFYV